MEDLRQLNERLVTAAKRVRVLTTLNWPAEVEDRFLEREGELPEPPEVHTDLAAEREELAAVRDAADPEDPAGVFVRRTATSYLHAAELLDAAGTPRFTELSRALYGDPDTTLYPGGPTLRDAAEDHLSRTECFPEEEPEPELEAEDAAEHLRRAIEPHLPDLPIEVAPGLTARSTAGSTRVRLRASARFRPTELDQLVQHEALVHTATKRNGLAQPVLVAMGLSSPRTTAMQEGLATLAELITDTMDIYRLRRVALRIRAVDAALNGADFLDVYRLMLAEHEDRREAFRSAARVFRGGDVRGGIAFTKDVVYLRGLFEVHAFLLAAARDSRHDLVDMLFCGRLTLGDAVELAPLRETGVVAAPRFVPPWARRLDRLAAYLIFAGVNDRVELNRVALSDFR